MHTSLMRMRPGGVIPAHRHEREEEFIILEGECYIGTHRLVAGDVHIAAAGSWHEPVTTESGVVVLLRGEYPHPNPA
jgi:quercetin dioxygenase-like cupin family protein